jgi:hypothetical protein
VQIALECDVNAACACPFRGRCAVKTYSARQPS